MAGLLESTFTKLDINNDGHIVRAELDKVFQSLDENSKFQRYSASHLEAEICLLFQIYIALSIAEFLNINILRC